VEGKNKRETVRKKSKVGQTYGAARGERQKVPKKEKKEVG